MLASTKITQLDTQQSFHRWCWTRLFDDSVLMLTHTHQIFYTRVYLFDWSHSSWPSLCCEVQIYTLCIQTVILPVCFFFFFILAEYYFLYFGYKYHLRCWYLVITWQNVAIGMRPLSDSMQRVLSVFHSLLYQTFKSLSASCGPAAVIKLGRPACLSASSLQLLLIKISPSSPSLCPALQEQLTPWHHHSLLVLPQTCSFLSVTAKYLKRTKLLRAHTAFHRYHGLE